ncbi:MAG: ferrochelatase [Pseudomonadales bacterium]
MRCFIAMRYWHPMTREAVQQVADYQPDRVVLLPLYPQYSTTTTGSSVATWHRAAVAAGLRVPTRVVCCYPIENGFVQAVTENIREALAENTQSPRPRVLFSAHGLPKKVVDRGDPYQWQVEQTAAAVVEALAVDGPDWVVCYQSRVGPLEWIGPSTDDEIKRAGNDGVPLIVVPIAFVSEHSETLVELDIKYARLAKDHGVPAYVRVGTVQAASSFVMGLAGVVRTILEAEATPCSHLARRLCPNDWTRCPAARE